MKKVLLITLGIAFAFSAFSQENLQPGYVVVTVQDTLKGFIDYRNWTKNPDKILFKQTKDNAGIEYFPKDIEGFGVLDEIYVSALVETDVSPYKLSELTYNFSPEIQTERVFLQTVLRGNKSLYFLINSIGKTQFYIYENSKFELLVYKKYLTDQAGSKIAVENNKYIGQLANYLGDCAEIKSKINSSNYTKKNLEKLFYAYYKCIDKEPQFYKKAENVSTELGVLGGISITNLNIISEGDPEIANATYESSLNPTGGVFFNLVLPGNQRKWSINNELIFTTYSIDGKHFDYTNENEYTNTYLTFGASQIKLNTMCRFKFPIKRIFIGLELGISNSYSFSITNDKIQERKFYTVDYLTEEDALNSVRKYEQGYFGGLSAYYKRYSLITRFEQANGFSASQFIKTNVGRIYFILAYKLK